MHLLSNGGRPSATMSSPIALFYASLFLHVVVAMPGLSMGPMPTPMGLMASAGMSPRPTEAPGSNGIPLELRKRQAVQYPPPENWCGFVEGDYSGSTSRTVLVLSLALADNSSRQSVVMQRSLDLCQLSRRHWVLYRYHGDVHKSLHHLCRLRCCL